MTVFVASGFKCIIGPAFVPLPHFPGPTYEVGQGVGPT
jgi:hypothetical protein